MTPHLEGLIRKWRDRAAREDEDGNPYEVEGSAIRLRLCADELEAALAALPGGGVEYFSHRCESCGNVDHFQITSTPTPLPHEADRNG